MVLTASNMLALGTQAPDFSLPDTVSDAIVDIDQIKSAKPKGLVVMFICNHCPYVKHIIDPLVEIANDYMHKGIYFVAISSNDADNYPDDSPEKMQELAEEKGFSFPYLYDETQEVAHAYHAACTPDIYLFDSAFELVYRGQFDDSRPGNHLPVTGKSLIDAMTALMEGRSIDSIHQKPSMGCNIKWK